MKPLILAAVMVGCLVLMSGCNKTPVDRGPVFSAVENTLAQPGPVRDDIVNRGLATIPSDNSSTPGDIKIGEIQNLIDAGVYQIDNQGKLKFGTNNITYFPVQKEIAWEDMLALLSGKLTLDNQGYLRIQGELIIWYHGFSYQKEGRDIWILNDKGTRVFRVGDDVTIGGGELPDYVVQEETGQPLPQGCKGPYWQMSQMAKIGDF